MNVCSICEASTILCDRKFLSGSNNRVHIYQWLKKRWQFFLKRYQTGDLLLPDRLFLYYLIIINASTQYFEYSIIICLSASIDCDEVKFL